MFLCSFSVGPLAAGHFMVSFAAVSKWLNVITCFICLQDRVNKLAWRTCMIIGWSHKCKKKIISLFRCSMVWGELSVFWDLIGGVIKSPIQCKGACCSDCRRRHTHTHTLLKHKHTHRHITHSDLFTFNMTGVCFKCVWQPFQMRRMGCQGRGTLLRVYRACKVGTETYAVVTTVEIPFCFYCHGCRNRSRTLQYLPSVWGSVVYICKASSVDMVRGVCRFHSVTAWLLKVMRNKRIVCSFEWRSVRGLY